MTPFEMRSRKMYEKFTIYENGLISANFVFFFHFIHLLWTGDMCQCMKLDIIISFIIFDITNVHAQLDTHPFVLLVLSLIK